MTKEKIIEIVNDCVQYNANQGTWSIDNRFADTLLAEIEQEEEEAIVKAKLEQINACAEEWKSEVKRFEQEKKEMAREILEDVFAPYNDIGGGLFELTPKDKRILAKKYEVKL